MTTVAEEAGGFVCSECGLWYETKEEANECCKEEFEEGENIDA